MSDRTSAPLLLLSFLVALLTGLTLQELVLLQLLQQQLCLLLSSFHLAQHPHGTTYYCQLSSCSFLLLPCHESQLASPNESSALSSHRQRQLCEFSAIATAAHVATDNSDTCSSVARFSYNTSPSKYEHLCPSMLLCVNKGMLGPTPWEGWTKDLLDEIRSFQTDSSGLSHNRSKKRKLLDSMLTSRRSSSRNGIRKSFLEELHPL